MATNRQGRSGPSFVDVLDDNTPYVVALYLMVVGMAAAFVDYSALARGELAYRTVGEAGGPLLEAIAGAFALGFVLTTLLAVAVSVDILLRERREGLEPYQLEERIGFVAVMPAMQLLTVVLCPIVTGVTVVAGLEFVIALVV